MPGPFTRLLRKARHGVKPGRGQERLRVVVSRRRQDYLDYLDEVSLSDIIGYIQASTQRCQQESDAKKKKQPEPSVYIFHDESSSSVDTETENKSPAVTCPTQSRAFIMYTDKPGNAVSQPLYILDSDVFVDEDSSEEHSK